VEGSRDDSVVNLAWPQSLKPEIACPHEDERRKMLRRYIEALNRNHEAVTQEYGLQVADEAWRGEIPRPSGPKYIVTKPMGKI
jgi:hypothetical protein